MSSSRKEEEVGPPDPGGPDGGGAKPKRPPLTRSTTGEGEGCNMHSPSSRAGGSGGAQFAGMTPPSIKASGPTGTSLEIIDFTFESLDKSPRGSKLVNSAKGGSSDVPGLTGSTSQSRSLVPSVQGVTSTNPDIPLLKIQTDSTASNPDLSDKGARPIGTSSPQRQTVNKDVLIIEGREYTFNRQGWARHSRDTLINREGFKRKMYQHERANWNAQERFQNEKKNRIALASTRGAPPHARNQTRTTHLRMMHQQSAQLRSGQPFVPSQDRKRQLSGETKTSAPGKKMAKSGRTIFCPPTASPSDHEDMEEDEENPEGREYWAQMNVRTHTCRIFASNDARLDDMDINYLSMMMVEKRDKDFADINDPAVLAESDKISVERIGKSGKHIRIKLSNLEGITWWRNFISTVNPIEEGSASRGHRYVFFAPGESMWTYFRVWVADGDVGHPETGQSLLEREITRSNPQLRGVKWKVQVVGSDGGRVVVKLALPSASAYSLIDSMEYRLMYGMDRLEIVPTTRVSVLSAAASGAGVGTDGAAGGGSTDPPAGDPEPSCSGTTEWRKGKDLSSSETEHSDLDTSTNTVIDDAERKRLLDSDVEEDKTPENEDMDTVTETAQMINDPAVDEQNAL